MKILGIIVLLTAIAVIVCMELISLDMIACEVREEERRKARRESKLMAERRYKKMLENTEYRITQRVTYTNETNDIKW